MQELRGTSARELEACRRELEEESARQRQHFLEELEFLKVQSEERLQDKINHLKVKAKLFRQEKEKMRSSEMSDRSLRLIFPQCVSLKNFFLLISTFKQTQNTVREEQPRQHNIP